LASLGGLFAFAQEAKVPVLDAAKKQAIVEFTVKDGSVIGLVGVYDNGDRLPYPKTK